ncbi:MAG: hypothetical protein LUD74_00655 [Tannerellaceae bacterium]|nr:hypothetical protein [Tannerellaceae bacterium]
MYQLSSREGLSNSAILSLCQDSERFMWIGSVDGLNVYNGVDINIFKPNLDELGSVSGNVIEEVWEEEDGIIWINTNHGLNRYNKRNRQIECYNEFEGKYYWAKTTDNEIFTIYENNKIHYYDKKHKRFNAIQFPDIVKNDIQRIFIDEENILWIMTNKGALHNALISYSLGEPVIISCNDFTHTCGILYAFMEENRIYFIDQNYVLFEMDPVTRKKSLILKLRKELENRGDGFFYH